MIIIRSPKPVLGVGSDSFPLNSMVPKVVHLKCPYQLVLELFVLKIGLVSITLVFFSFFFNSKNKKKQKKYKKNLFLRGRYLITVVTFLSKYRNNLYIISN